MNKLFDLKLKTIPRESYGSNNNAKHSKNIKTYKDDSSLLEQLKSEINSITDKNSENNLSMHDNLIQSSEENESNNKIEISKMHMHKEKSLESLLNNTDSEEIDNQAPEVKNTDKIIEKSSNKISSIKNMIAKMKSENNINNKYDSLSLNGNQNQLESIDLNNLNKNSQQNINQKGFDSLSEPDTEKEHNNMNNNPMIDNFNNKDQNFMFLKKKIIRKKAAKSKKIIDAYEQFKEQNANERRSMRIKINSLKTDNKAKVKVNKNPKKEENENKENNSIRKLNKNKNIEFSKKIEGAKNIFNDKIKEDDSVNENKDNRLFAFSIAEMLKRNREGENVTFEITNLDEVKKSTPKKKLTKENILEENLNKLKKAENNSSKAKNKKQTKKDVDNIKKADIDEAEMLLDDMEIPKSNNIIKVLENKGNHKNPLKYNKKITQTEVSEIKTSKVKLELLEYLKTKIDLLNIHKSMDHENKEDFLSEELTNKFDMFSLLSFDIENIFNQKIDLEMINSINLSSYSIYEKINFVFDLIFENVESLEIANVFVFVFSFLKGLVKCSSTNNVPFNTTEVYEIIFGYFTVKINEILSDETIRNKCFLNNLVKNKISENEENSENTLNIIKGIFDIILLNKENDNLFERIFIKNEFLNLQYFLSFNLAILFYLNIENFYDELLDNKLKVDKILIIKNFDYFRLMQDFLLGINYSEKNIILKDPNINNNNGIKEPLAYEILKKIFELYCLFTEKINLPNLHIPDNLYDNKQFSKSNNIMFAENLKEKIFTTNFFYIIRKIFLCDQDQINFDINIPTENNNLKVDEINTLKKQNLVLQIFANLYLSYIPNIAMTSSEDNVTSFNLFNTKMNVLRIVELTQFIELAKKIHKIPLVYTTVFEQVLWPEFTKPGQSEFARRIILYLISILFKFILKEDSMFKFEQTKNLMNWLYAIIDPKFDVEKILPIDRIIALYGLLDLCRFDLTFINAIKTFLSDILKKCKIDDFPIDLKEKLLNKFGVKLEMLMPTENNLFADENIENKDNLQRIIVANR